MSERDPTLSQQSPDMAPVVAIGGLLSFKTQWYLYSQILSDSSSALSAKERFLPIPDRGLSPFSDMIGQLDEQLDELYEKLEEPVVLAGHSLGALMAEELTLLGPHRVRGVALYAGVHDGIQEVTPTGKLLKRALGNPDHAEDLLADSDFMVEHREKRETVWPDDTPHRVYSATYDDLIPAPQGLKIVLPEGQTSELRVVKPILPRLLGFGISKRTEGIPNIRWLRSLLPASHYDVVISPPVISDTHELRRSVMPTASERVTKPKAQAIGLLATAAA